MESNVSIRRCAPDQCISNLQPDGRVRRELVRLNRGYIVQIHPDIYAHLFIVY